MQLKQIDLSCVEHTPAGVFLGSVIYRDQNLFDVFRKGEFYSSPHNGGKHTLVLNVDKEHAGAFIDLVAERYAARRGCAEFVEHARKKLN